jgi:hypothetical protein
MGQIFKIVGILALGGFFFGEKIVDSLYDKIEYSFGALRRGDIRFDFRKGKLVGLFDLRLNFKQSFGVNDTQKRMKLTFRQQSTIIGVLDVLELTNLPHAETVQIPMTVVVPAGPFLARLQEITKPGNLASALAPLEISGAAYLASGVTVPVHYSLNFLSFG